MSLYIYQPGIQPLGQFDVVDSYASATYIKGGEVGTLVAAARANSTTEKSAYDVKDGYDNSTSLKRVAVSPFINAAGTFRPIWLLDEGTTGYGTLFGSVIGSPVGLCTGKGSGSTCSTALGPHTTAGSGKVTCWDKPGLYAVSADAVDTTTGAGNGLVLANTTLSPGAKIRPLGTGKLTYGTAGVIDVEVARFVEFECGVYMVTTPASLVGATQTVDRVVISFHVV